MKYAIKTLYLLASVFMTSLCWLLAGLVPHAYHAVPFASFCYLIAVVVSMAVAGFTCWGAFLRA